LECGDHLSCFFARDTFASPQQIALIEILFLSASFIIFVSEHIPHWAEADSHTPVPGFSEPEVKR
jgi:hypothetical protein